MLLRSYDHFQDSVQTKKQLSSRTTGRVHLLPPGPELVQTAAAESPTKGLGCHPSEARRFSCVSNQVGRVCTDRPSADYGVVGALSLSNGRESGAYFSISYLPLMQHKQTPIQRKNELTRGKTNVHHPSFISLPSLVDGRTHALTSRPTPFIICVSSCRCTAIARARLGSFQSGVDLSRGTGQAAIESSSYPVDGRHVSGLCRGLMFNFTERGHRDWGGGAGSDNQSRGTS